MTQLEILRMAYYGICAKMQHEEDIDRNTMKEHGRHNSIAQAHIRKLYEQQNEISRLILEEEQRAV